MNQDEKFILETFYGIHMGKNDPFNPPIRGSTLQLTVQHPKNEIPQPCEGGNNRKTPRRDPSHWTLTKQLPNHGENTGNCSKCEEKHPDLQPSHEEERTWMHNGWVVNFWVLTCPLSQNTFFLKWVLCPIQNWPPYLAHSHAITNSTTFWMTGHKRQNG